MHRSRSNGSERAAGGEVKQKRGAGEEPSEAQQDVGWSVWKDEGGEGRKGKE